MRTIEEIRELKKAIEEACRKYKYKPNIEINRLTLADELNNILNAAAQSMILKSENISFKVENDEYNRPSIFPLYKGRKIVFNKTFEGLKDFLQTLVELENHDVQYEDELKPIEYIEIEWGFDD